MDIPPIGISVFLGGRGNDTGTTIVGHTTSWGSDKRSQLFLLSLLPHFEVFRGSREERIRAVLDTKSELGLEGTIELFLGGFHGRAGAHQVHLEEMSYPLAILLVEEHAELWNCWIHNRGAETPAESPGGSASFYVAIKQKNMTLATLYVELLKSDTLLNTFDFQFFTDSKANLTGNLRGCFRATNFCLHGWQNRQHGGKRQYCGKGEVLVSPPPMKNAVVLILAAIIAGSGWWFVKKSEPEIDRRPVSYWLKGLTDGDPQVQNESLQKLQYAEPRHLQEARPRLRYLADHGSALAVSILYQKFHEANDSWLPSFVVLRHSCGLEPLREIARRDPKEVIDQLAEIPHKSEDVLRLLTELEIQVQPAAVEAINRDWAKDLEGKMRDAHAYQRQALEDKGDLTEPAEGH